MLTTPNMDASSTKIGYLLRMYPRFTQTFVANEILELERQGADIGIFSLRLPNEGIFHESCSRVQARAHYLPDNRPTGRLSIHRYQWRLLRRRPRVFLRMRAWSRQHRGVQWYQAIQASHVIKWAKRNSISRLHVHFGTDEATVALLANLLGAVPFSLTLHAFDIFRSNVDKKLLARKINASRFTVTVSDYNRRYMMDQLPGVDAEKIRVNYNGIDLEKFAPSGQEREPMSIFSVGRLIEKKGFVHLIRAVKRLRDRGIDAVCRIAGEGREQKSLEQEIRSLGLTKYVELLGRIRQADVAAHLKRASCFVLPCVHAEDGNVDALPTVLLESLASGCPSVSTKISGVPEIIEDGKHGLLVEPGEDEGLAHAIARILTDPSLAAAFARDGRRRAEDRFDVRKNVALMHHWLQEADAPNAPHTLDTSDAPDGRNAASKTPHEAVTYCSPTAIHETAQCRIGS